jgi:hypothetical protein
MKISINVPTYLRAGMVDTFKILPDASYWVHEFEVEAYKKAHPKMKIRTLTDKIRGNVARVRNHILDETETDDVSVQIDDDVHYLFYFDQCERVHVKKQAEIVKFIERMTTIAGRVRREIMGY